MNNQLEPRGKWSLRDRFLAALQGKLPRTRPQKMKADAIEASDQQNDPDHNSLVNLPGELVLMIANYLDREYQLLLSLSCRRFRDLLDSSLDLTLEDDKEAKIRFLRLLELDHSEYLTCRPCGFMYLWKKRKYYQYTCPRGRHRHTMDDILKSYSQHIYGGDWGPMQVGRGVVDLILRAAEYGPAYGLPVSYLNKSGYRRGVSRMHEARVVNGQLMLASRHQFETATGQEMAELDRSHKPAVCFHATGVVGIEKVWQTFEKAVVNMTAADWSGSDVFKCPYCETDHQVRAKKEGNRTAIVLTVWRNYGRRHEHRLSTEQIFHRFPKFQLDASEVTQRNMHATFDYGLDVGEL